MNNEIMYDINSVLLVTMLFIAILLFYELGFRIGKNKQEDTFQSYNVRLLPQRAPNGDAVRWRGLNIY